MAGRISATKVKEDGFTFDSKREHARYLELRLLERANKIADLEVHPRIKIEIGGVPIKYPNGRQLVYVADFRYYQAALGGVISRNTPVEVQITEDSKGFRTQVYKIKRALVEAMGLEILET